VADQASVSLRKKLLKIWEQHDTVLEESRHMSSQVEDDLLQTLHKTDAIEAISLIASRLSKISHSLRFRRLFICSNIFWKENISTTTKNTEMGDIRFLVPDCLKRGLPF